MYINFPVKIWISDQSVRTKNNHVENFHSPRSDKLCSVCLQSILRQDILDLMQSFCTNIMCMQVACGTRLVLFSRLSPLHPRLFFLFLITRIRVDDPVISSWLGRCGYQLAATGRCTTGLLRMCAHMHRRP